MALSAAQHLRAGSRERRMKNAVHGEFAFAQLPFAAVCNRRGANAVASRNERVFTAISARGQML